MRVLVTGSSGLLGSKLLAAMRSRPELVPLAAARRAPDARHADAVAFWSLDITDRRRVQGIFGEAAPHAVVHAAAMTDVDGCELDPERAWAVNVAGTEHVVEACEQVGASLVHLSTEYVFDGEAGPYVETDQPRPLSVYGKTKLASERVVARCGQRWAVARTTVVFGYAPRARHNFVLWLLDRLARGERVRVVADQVGSPTLADNLAEMVLALVTEGGHGENFPRQGIHETTRHYFQALSVLKLGNLGQSRFDFT